MLISLDVDGVLADEQSHIAMCRGLGLVPEDARATAALTQQTGFWTVRKPLWRPTADEIAIAAAALNDSTIQVVSKREQWLESASMSWVSHYYPWLMPFIRRVQFVGQNGSKVRGVVAPDVAIDDSTKVLREYIAADIRCIGVGNDPDLLRLPILVCPNLGAALRRVRG